MTAEEKKQEEAKRLRVMGDTVWANIAAMTSMAESLLPPEQRRNRPRLPVPMQFPRPSSEQI